VTGNPIRVLAVMEATHAAGPARNLIEFARRAAAPAHQMRPVALSLATYRRGDSETPFIAAARAAGIPVFVIPERRRFDITAAHALRDIVRECRPDILQSHNVKSHLFVRALGLYYDYPWIVFNHGYTSTNVKDRVYNQLDRWSMRAAFRVVAVCEPFARRLEARGIARERIRIQHNPVQPYVAPAPENVAGVRRDLGLTDEPVILAVGRLSREKGHADLVRAVAAMGESLGRARVVFVGDGPERSRVYGMVTRLNLGTKIVFTGHQLDVRPYYALATLLALPSHSEGSPNVVLEAMSAKVPVIGTAVGGVPELVAHEQTGLIVPPRDTAAMAGAIARLLDDGGLRTRLAHAAQEHVRLQHTPAAYDAALVSLYEDVLGSYPLENAHTPASHDVIAIGR
jgi:glycosyltransferase involved in cell wall biosynthesis